MLKKAENDKKAREGREKADAEKARIAATEAGGATIVGKSGNDAATEKEKAATIKANLDSQKFKGGFVKYVTLGTGRFAGTGNAWTETSVDADTAVNDVNKNNESDYFHIVINGLLKPSYYI